MTIYRLTKAAYAGSAFRGSRGNGRWHRAGTPVVYAADTPATALLETLVHAGQADLVTMPYVVFDVTLDPDRHLARLPDDLLPPDWQSWRWPASTQEIGTYWFQTSASAILEVPCAIVPFHRNYLINPQHSQFTELHIGGPRDFPIDSRLI